jgi:hypothetical protein
MPEPKPNYLFQEGDSTEYKMLVQNMIAECIASKQDPFQYAEKNGIDLSDRHIEFAIGRFSPTTQEEYDVLFELAKNSKCCTGRNCSGNMCPKNLFLEGMKFKSLHNNVELFKQGKKDSNQGVFGRGSMFKDNLDTMIRYATTKEKLQEILNELPNIQNAIVGEVENLDSDILKQRNNYAEALINKTRIYIERKISSIEEK